MSEKQKNILSWILVFVVMICGIIHTVNPKDITNLTLDEIEGLWYYFIRAFMFFVLSFGVTGLFNKVREYFNGKKK